MNKFKEFLKNNPFMQFVCVFMAGIVIGALFYPTKHIDESLTTKYESEIKLMKAEHTLEVSKVTLSLAEANMSYQELKKSSEEKVIKLTSEIHTLQSKQKTAYYKVVRPDGTIEIKKFTESEVDESSKVVSQIQSEFKQKIESIEQKWSVMHKERVSQIQKEFDSKEEEYKKQINELHQTKVVDINKKSFGVEAGALLDKSYYGHVTYDVFGPFFLGLQSQFGSQNTAGLGVGLRL